MSFSKAIDELYKQRVDTFLAKCKPWAVAIHELDVNITYEEYETLCNNGMNSYERHICFTHMKDKAAIEYIKDCVKHICELPEFEIASTYDEFILHKGVFKLLEILDRCKCGK